MNYEDNSESFNDIIILKPIELANQLIELSTTFGVLNLMGFDSILENID